MKQIPPPVFSKYWTTHKDQCYVLEGQLEEGNFSIICSDSYILIEDEDTRKAVARKMIEAGVQVISRREYVEKLMQKSEEIYNQWVRNGKPYIELDTKHQNLDEQPFNKSFLE